MGDTDDADLKKLRRSLAASKSWVTRSHKPLKTLIEDADPDVLALRSAVTELEKRLAAFDTAQGELELDVPDHRNLIRVTRKPWFVKKKIIP